MTTNIDYVLISALKGGVAMVELLIRLEYKRQALRRRVLGNFTDAERRFLFLGAFGVFMYLFSAFVAPGLAPFTLLPAGVVIGLFVLLGIWAIVIPPVAIVWF